MDSFLESCFFINFFLPWWNVNGFHHQGLGLLNFLARSLDLNFIIHVWWFVFLGFDRDICLSFVPDGINIFPTSTNQRTILSSVNQKEILLVICGCSCGCGINGVGVGKSSHWNWLVQAQVQLAHLDCRYLVCQGSAGNVALCWRTGRDRKTGHCVLKGFALQDRRARWWSVDCGVE